jgi:hypothetical protein
MWVLDVRAIGQGIDPEIGHLSNRHVSALIVSQVHSHRTQRPTDLDHLSLSRDRPETGRQVPNVQVGRSQQFVSTQRRGDREPGNGVRDRCKKSAMKCSVDTVVTVRLRNLERAAPLGHGNEFETQVLANRYSGNDVFQMINPRLGNRMPERIHDIVLDYELELCFPRFGDL